MPVSSPVVPDTLAMLGNGVAAIFLYAAVGTVLMVAAFYAIDLTTPGALPRLVRDGRPNAVLITCAGLLGMALIVVVAIHGSAGRLAEGLLGALVFGAAGIVAQVAAVRLLAWLTRLDMGPMVEDTGFRAAAAVVASAHLAVGMVVAVAVS